MLTPKEGRIRHYRFTFKIAKGQVIVSWLDRAGHEQLRIENNDSGDSGETRLNMHYFNPARDDATTRD